MPVTLLVRAEEGSPQRALTFDGERVVVGRGPSSDVRLPDPSVSHRHATLRHGGAGSSRGWVVVDEGSTNGTFVGGVRISPGASRALRHGDLVRVGRVWLEVRIDQAPATSDLSVATRDLALALVAEAMAKIGDDPITKLRVVEGRDMDMVLRMGEEGRVYVLGRAEHCDLPLADEDASREHTRVVRRGGAVMVRDTGSKNGTFLGEVPAPTDRDTPWPRGALMRIGRTVIALEEPAQYALEELEAAADERIPEAESPPPPPPSSKALPASRKSSPGEEPAPPPSVRSPGAAPIARVGDVITKSSTTTAPRRWTATDLLVIVIALSVIGISIAGLVWLLKG
jgi:pSer/pThr/pTyr-binding forkhead associated (FHA) protein